MTRYILKRIGMMIFVIFGVLLFIFVLLYLTRATLHGRFWGSLQRMSRLKRRGTLWALINRFLNNSAIICIT